MIRKAAVSGQFYSASCEEIQEQISHFNALLDENLQDKELLQKYARLIISPHAGYVYSGFTANIAHRILANSKPKRIVVIGPSHRVYIEGASISLHKEYETPCGSLKMDLEYSEKLQLKYHLHFQENAHQEHSTETQFPFIKHYLPSAKVCEIVYGEINFQVLAELMYEVLQDDDNAVVISTDLSHFYDLQKANLLDNICLDAIATLDNEKMSGLCEACGKIGVMAAIEAAKKLSFKAELLDYRTSADVSGDKQSVVGYLSAILGLRI